MANYRELVIYLKAIAHPTRLEILDMLRSGEICVCHIEKALAKRQAYVSQQLMKLRDSGLVQSRKEGLKVYYALKNTQVKRWLDVVLEPAEDVIPLIEGCPCPMCQSEPVAIKESICCI